MKNIISKPHILQLDNIYVSDDTEYTKIVFKFILKLYFFNNFLVSTIS